MNFKKKLFMMSLAASMAVPSNLALVASVATPVLADNEKNDFEFIKGLIEEAKIPNEILKFLNVKFGENEEIIDCGGIISVLPDWKRIQVKSGEYRLTDDIVNEEGTLDLGGFSISLESDAPNVVIDLNEHTITSDVKEGVFIVAWGTLTLTGGGTVKCTSNDPNAAVVHVAGLEGDDLPLYTANVDVQKDVTLEATSGGLGIYQMGKSKTSLTNCTIKGRTGIEVQSGTLEVLGGSITSTSTDLKVKDCDDGIYTTYGAAIAIVPQDFWRDFKNITVDINGGATLTGIAGLVLIDPEKEFKNLANLPERDVTVKVDNTSFGNENTYDIGYDSNMWNSLEANLDNIESIPSKFYKLKYSNDFKLEMDGTPITSITLASEPLSYTGTPIEPEVTVKQDENSLESGSYIVTYKNNKNAGTAKAIAIGVGDYTGAATTTFEIKPASITEATITGFSDFYDYSGTAIKPTVTVTLKDKTLTQDADYTVSYGSNTAVGQATVTVTGKDNYIGTKTATFEITAY